MAFFNWNDGFSVGVGCFDDEHRRLIDLINSLYDALRENREEEILDRALDELLDYTRTHFAHEEALLAEYGYSGFDEHKKEHETLTLQAEALREQFRAGSASVLLDAGKFLRNWLSNHILGMDMSYGAFLNSKGVN